jgi:hypothetical protein
MRNDSERGYLAFCAAMERGRRTLQQAFTRLCAAWYVSAADPDYRTELRNDLSISHSKEDQYGQDNSDGQAGDAHD